VVEKVDTRGQFVRHCLQVLVDEGEGLEGFEKGWELVVVAGVELKQAEDGSEGR